MNKDRRKMLMMNSIQKVIFNGPERDEPEKIFARFFVASQPTPRTGRG